MYTSRTVVIWLVCVLSLVGCRRLVEAPQSATLLDNRTVYASDGNAETAMLGIYIQMMNNPRAMFNADISVLTALSCDELTPVTLSKVEDSFYLNRLTASNQLNTTLYTGAYQLLYSINSLLDGLARSSGVSKPKKQALDGEGKFCRALVYFYLINLYGDVPLVTGSLYTSNAKLLRSTVGVVYQQVEADLLDAEQELPVEYVNDDDNPGGRTRPNQAAARALLARIYLYMGEWAMAEQAATVVISDGRYRLEVDLDTVFLAGSQEAIWQLQPLYADMATADGYLFLPDGDGMLPSYTLSKVLLDDFEPGDLRRTHWTKSVVAQGKTYTIPYKYKQRMYAAGNPENEMVLRLAELYLIRAEARAHQGNLGGAIADLDLVRQRAGLGGIGVSEETEVLQAIKHERRIELSTEWGHRWLDLKRMGQVDLLLKTEKAGWEAMDSLYPIPASERQANPSLSQNWGY